MTASLCSSLPLTVYMQYGVEALGQNGRPSYTTIVLLFVVRTGNGVRTPFSPSHVVAWAREELGLDLDRRRVHEAINYLKVKGVFERVARGKYVVKDSTRLYVELSKRLEKLGRMCVRCTGVQRSGGRGGRLVWDGECVVLLRDHMVVRRVGRVDVVGLVLGLLRAVSFKARLYRWVVGFLRRLLRGMGVSWYLIRRVVREATRLFDEVRRRGRILVGGHGCVGYERGRCVRGRFYPLEELVRLVAGDNGVGPWFREFGFDIVLCPSKPGEDVDVDEAARLVAKLREVVGHSDVYAPAPHTGSRR